jgi:protein-S-isoprenylcysteine O-methyltransferase Ste14
MTMDSRSIAGGVIQGCWIIFILYWLISSLFTKRTTYKPDRGVQAGYRILAMLAWFLLIRAHHSPYPLSRLVIPKIDSVGWIAAALSLCGLGVCLWARITIGQNWSGDVTLKESHELIQRGPYRFVRHPIYTGILMIFLGSALFRGYLGGLVALGILFGSFWIKLRMEEELMLKQFPNEYPAYMQRVKRLIPFII